MGADSPVFFLPHPLQLVQGRKVFREGAERMALAWIMSYSCGLCCLHSANVKQLFAWRTKDESMKELFKKCSWSLALEYRIERLGYHHPPIYSHKGMERGFLRNSFGERHSFRLKNCQAYKIYLGKCTEQCYFSRSGLLQLSESWLQVLSTSHARVTPSGSPLLNIHIDFSCTHTQNLFDL